MSAFSANDHAMMSLALQLAERGIYTTSPNPMVGCVVVSSDGDIVGQGWHQRAGGPHAEIFALRQAGNKAANATVYVTLEPCSHHGRTPPCAEALIKAGVKKVICAMVDPNPQVSGRGMELLANAGIETASGLLEHQASQLNRGFIKRMQQGKPFVSLKMAASLDGKIALNNGHSQWITGTAARREVQSYRARSCAILTGSGTVLADDPLLNVRFDELHNPPRFLTADNIRQPLRVIIDSQNKVSSQHRIVNQGDEVLLVNKNVNPQPFSAHVSQWQGPGNLVGKMDLGAILAHMGQLQINQVWVEAGAGLAGALLAAKLIDEMIIYIAPRIMGDKSQNLLNLPLFEHMEQTIGLQWQDVRQIGDDLKIVATPLYQ
ncbi:bifunctional diaminohydroxyphosphoribosylaminopyrimidine deaminase/5-amino-6-(5-phosphoribosylamino)uracil reductase RibD [Neptunicella sp. SCSIO 80796]|uniref:bifunctional diaminohydroxyphosphoribosylaminopyrimidine deaminase/5-amino-6-(5-phosphoribosylamino)uracil reductase RibD n=1 Tax=Neptunicella plasticusilytica TaxID=3117012 RepID=UPI003A4E63A4